MSKSDKKNKKIKIKHCGAFLYPLLDKLDKGWGIEFTGKYAEEQQKAFEDWKLNNNN